MRILRLGIEVWAEVWDGGKPLTDREVASLTLELEPGSEVWLPDFPEKSISGWVYQGLVRVMRRALAHAEEAENGHRPSGNY